MYLICLARGSFSTQRFDETAHICLEVRIELELEVNDISVMPTCLVAKGRHTRVEGTVVQRHRKRNELGRATREILESIRVGLRIVRPARGNKGKGKGQGEYRSKRKV